MNNLILSIIFLLLFSSSYGQITSNEIMQRADKVLQGHQTISYELNNKVKFFSKSDTLKNIAKCHLQYIPNDKTKFYHHIEEIEGYNQYRYKQIYKGDTLINLRPNDSSVLIIATKEKEAYTFYNKQAIPSFIRSNFKGRGYFSKLIENKNVKNLSLTETEKSYVIKFTINENKKDDNDDYNYDYTFDKETFLPINLTETTTFEGMSQYQSITISNIKFNPTIQPKLFDIESNIPSTTKRIVYNPKTYFKKNVTLKKNEKAPVIKHNTIQDVEFDLSEYKGKTVILDFWYIGCYACIFSMAEMEQLSQKYDTSKVVLIGVNVADSVNKIQPFLERRNITYNHIYNGQSVAQNYQVSAYPTLIIIDKNGNIYERHEGWMVSKGLFKKMYVRSFHKKIKKSLKVKSIIN